MKFIGNALIAALLSLGSITAATAAPAHAHEVFASCDAGLVRQAAERMLDDPDTLQQPIVLFLAAQGLRIHGDKDEAAFFYLLGRLRASRQAMVEKGDAGQVVGAMTMTIAPLIMPDLGADPDFARIVIARVLALDKARPDPFRERALTEGGRAATDIAMLEASFIRLPISVRRYRPRQPRRRRRMQRSKSPQ